jgi:chromosome partitioning protein
VALTRALSGRDVLIVDGGRQASIQMAVAIRGEAERKPGLTCVQYHDGALLQVQRQASKYDDVVIDAGGRDSTALRAPLFLADLLIFPFQPRSVDVWALADIAGLVDEANGVRDGRRARVVLNAADPGQSSDNTDALAALADVPQLTLLDTPNRRRKAFANALGLGLSLDGLNSRDPKACEELATLTLRVFGNDLDIKIPERAMK